MVDKVDEVADPGCEICSDGTPLPGEDICEECYEAWAEDELKTQEAELANELAYEASLEMPSMYEPIDEWEHHHRIKDIRSSH